ncbi:uncharacterized protein I206_104681 [Kwoniella pini CBS 10737]|uniref:Uncharacterized protein n=1 Tax=Kwoniella pini CBS 10737 TaxID=1296096 RepID=A0A1B9I7G8_9TREE|nr:uncharacterized protein I206_02219 [Kwoniella pini CBS 10737]OCF51505.1 hypothetical protein I206_02219 [Kwoniella pini CBS 10737]
MTHPQSQITTNHATRKSSFGSVFVESPTIVSADQIRLHDPTTEILSNGDLKGKSKAKDLSYLIISGGTGANSIASAFGNSPAFVLPVSDDGGSSSEILRCFGGPSIGDIRSRLIRLIPLVDNPTSKDDIERLAIYNLLAYRFPSSSSEKVVRELWHEIVEGRSDLWDGIGEDKKECIRAFLVHFQTLCLKRAHKRFSFRNFSLGNGFLTGARDLFGSLPSAIFLFKSIAGVNSGVQVIPVINTNQTVTIAAQLLNSTVLVGQCNISHPTTPITQGSSTSTMSTSNVPSAAITPIPAKANIPVNIRNHFRRDSRTFDTPETAFTSPRNTYIETFGQINEGSEGWSKSNPINNNNESGGNLGYRKGEEETPLESKIERVFYINLYGQEIYPEPNSEFIESLNQRDILVYSCGSLWTSIIPCLSLRNLSNHISSSKSLKAKVLLLNSSNDRETPNYNASEYLITIFKMLNHFNQSQLINLNQQYNQSNFNNNEIKISNLISHIVYLEGSKIQIDKEIISNFGIKLIQVSRDVHKFNFDQGQIPLFTPESVEWAMEKVLEDP